MNIQWIFSPPHPRFSLFAMGIFFSDRKKDSKCFVPQKLTSMPSFLLVLRYHNTCPKKRLLPFDLWHSPPSLTVEKHAHNVAIWYEEDRNVIIMWFYSPLLPFNEENSVKTVCIILFCWRFANNSGYLFDLFVCTIFIFKINIILICLKPPKQTLNKDKNNNLLVTAEMDRQKAQQCFQFRDKCCLCLQTPWPWGAG